MNQDSRQTMDGRHWSEVAGAPATIRTTTKTVQIESVKKAGRKRSVVVYAVLGALVVAAFLTLHLLGISAYVVTGGSMAGAISKGSLAVERPVPVGSLQVGDVITFHPPGEHSNVTHRIIAIDKGPQGQSVFQTKGDANQAVDPWQITLDRPNQAEVMFSIPWVGYGMAIFTLRWVRTGLLALAALALILGVVLYVIQGDDKKEHLAEATTSVDGRGAGH